MRCRLGGGGRGSVLPPATAAGAAAPPPHPAHARQLPPQHEPGGTAAWRHWGGVPVSDCVGAPCRQELLARLLPLLAGRLVVGHGVGRDAAALGLAAAPWAGGSSGVDAAGFLELRLPPCAGGGGDTTSSSGPTTPASSSSSSSGGGGGGGGAAVVAYAYDTKAFPGFQGRGGSAHTLARLAADHLGRAIQASGGDGGAGGRGRQRARAPHDAAEDAGAAMELWLRVARPALLLAAAAALPAAYERLVELQTAELLAGRRGGGGGRNPGGDGGDWAG